MRAPSCNDQHRCERRGASRGAASNGLRGRGTQNWRRRDGVRIAAYYTDIRRGRPPSEEQLAELTRRYAAIGGLSPLHQRTEAQRSTLAHQLQELAPDEFVVAVGLRHAEPAIEKAVGELAAAGVGLVVGLVLAPHYSPMSVGAYLERAGQAATSLGIPFRGITSWATEPAYVDYLAGAVAASLQHPPMPADTPVLFTAHSLPRRILDTGDPYPEEVASTAALVAAEAGLAAGRWSVAWQSPGRTAEPWLDVIDALAAGGDGGAVLACPCGFVADHLEVLYDLDIEARQRAEAGGLEFRRTAVVNDDSRVMAALARRVVAAATAP
jgi:ferrochelatase